MRKLHYILQKKAKSGQKLAHEQKKKKLLACFLQWNDEIWLKNMFASSNSLLVGMICVQGPKLFVRVAQLIFAPGPIYQVNSATLVSKKIKLHPPTQHFLFSKPELSQVHTGLYSLMISVVIKNRWMSWGVISPVQTQSERVTSEFPSWRGHDRTNHCVHVLKQLVSERTCPPRASSSRLSHETASQKPHVEALARGIDYNPSLWKQNNKAIFIPTIPQVSKEVRLVYNKSYLGEETFFSLGDKRTHRAQEHGSFQHCAFDQESKQTSDWRD